MKYISIENNKELEYLLSFFDDSIIHECIIKTHGYVDDKYYMYNDWGNFDLKMLLQIQDEDTPALEIVFRNVTQFKFSKIVLENPKGYIIESKLCIVYDQPLEVIVTKDNFLSVCDIVSEKIEYRFLNNHYLGENASLT
ncbi:MAG: hypothetical protein PHQ75_13630 [Thermoguttaceae bacterium]|nr:hypothetical protein [Thermoguttaceae bacterium]